MIFDGAVPASIGTIVPKHSGAPMANSINILHLSDLHFGYDRDTTAKQARSEVLNGLVKIAKDLQPQLLVISGDLTYQGKEQGYTELADWLTNKLFAATGLKPEDCVICPGNHDLDRNETMGIPIDSVAAADKLLRPEKLDRHLAPPFHRFQKFANAFGIVPPVLQDKPNHLVGVRLIPEHNLRFICANSAWFCGDKDQGKLFLGRDQFIAMGIDEDEHESGPITIALVHHPHTWLHSDDTTDYKTRESPYTYLAKRSHLILSGHTHGLVKESKPYERARVILAGATYQDDSYSNNFSLLQIDKDRSFTRLAHEFDAGTRKWRAEKSERHSLRAATAASLPRPIGQSPDLYLAWLRTETNEVDLRNFIDRQSTPDPKIDALYARLMTPGSAGEEFGELPEARQSIPLDEALKHPRVLIVGDAGSGKSTFLRRVAWALSRENPDPVLRLPHLRFPIFVRVRELDAYIAETKGGPDKPDDPAWLPHFLARQFQWGLDETFWRDRQADSEAILLLDGLDEAASSDRRDDLVAMLENISKNAACQIAVTTRPMDLARKDQEGWRTIHIAPLDSEGVNAFLLQWSRWLKKDNEPAAQEYYRLLQSAVSIPDLRELVSNPLMLTSLAVLYLNGKELPRHRAGLYDGILTWLARHAHEHCRAYTEGEYLDRLAELALGMQIAKEGQTLKIGELEAARLITRPERSLTPAQDFITLAQLHSGIITLRGGLLEFWHRSFQEYLAARCLAGFLDAARLAQALQLLYTQEGREVLPLLAVRLSNPQLTHLLPGLIGDALLKDKLEQRAHAVGVLGRMVTDIKPKELSDLAPDAVQPYQDLRESVMGIFTKGIAATIGVKTRADAAEALDLADPRARLFIPTDDRYWSPILSGSFQIGGDKAAFQSLDSKTVRVPPFQIGRFPVTVWEYGEYLKANPEVAKPEYWPEQSKHPSRPVVNVDWAAADRYCRHFGRSLPTDEHWEFAARGPQSRIYPWKGNGKPGEPFANCQNTLSHPSPVGIFPDGDTPEGVSDMLGNVWEWTCSEFEPGRYSVRGASFYDEVGVSLRAASRVWYVPDVRFVYLGFRCVREV